ncbi:Gfo/Idh/MocA family protein [Halorubrum sp. SD626R]|uniref:Gfo/Idh/MocA family protein n=1 Tax=Halorubrum sp. SD626R TaxID=1419722 RepID=UPI000A81D3A2|nr:Gfo/Idh/MocA family oxidoreductase [Halorubrum sp. SD626R]TKX82262.1 Gfo/Idh/MocA family oxidoreductase [Halorubrum sp. SD626R]
MTDVGVIGVGSMGINHSRVYNTLPEANLVGVSDMDEERATEVAERYDTAALGLDALIERVDAVSVAVPTQFHYEIGCKCIKGGVDILVEKPFVDDPERGEELVELADREGVRIQVGHIERFNPAVLALEDVLAGKEVLAYEVRRLGPDPGRDIQDSVVTDLMIHDLDIIRNLVGEDPEHIDGVGRVDGRHATSTLTFSGEAIATLTASRVTEQKIRELGIATDEGYVSVDYLDRRIEIYRGSMRQMVSRDDKTRYRHESVIERPFVENIEPLKRELQSFLDTVSGGGEPSVTAEDGLAAVRLAQAVEHEVFPNN